MKEVDQKELERLTPEPEEEDEWSVAIRQDPYADLGLRNESAPQVSLQRFDVLQIKPRVLDPRKPGERPLTLQDAMDYIKADEAPLDTQLMVGHCLYCQILIPLGREWELAESERWGVTVLCPQCHQPTDPLVLDSPDAVTVGAMSRWMESVLPRFVTYEDLQGLKNKTKARKLAVLRGKFVLLVVFIFLGLGMGAGLAIWLSKYS